MNKSTQQEFDTAMRALDELCAVHRIKANDKLREIFWEGVVHGWNRASVRLLRSDVVEEKPVRPKTPAQASEHDSRIESSVGLSDAPKKRGNDLNQAGTFRL